MIPDKTLTALTEGPNHVHAGEGATVFAEGPGVDLFRLIVIRQSLEFEVKTGMRMTRVSALKAANEVLGTSYRSKAKALDHLNAVMEAARGEGIDP